MLHKMLYCSVFLIVLGGLDSVQAHPSDQSKGDPSHDNSQPHLPMDYDFHDSSRAYPAPLPAGDGHFWWKGNLHTHTLWSDGDQFPEVVAKWYVEHGYHFLAISDHNIIQEGEKWVNPKKSYYTNRPGIQNAGGMAVYERYQKQFDKQWIETRLTSNNVLEIRLKPLNEFRHLFEIPGRFMLVQSEELTSAGIHLNATNIKELSPFQEGKTPEQTISLNIDAIYEQRKRTGRPMVPHLNHPNFPTSIQHALTAEDFMAVENLAFFEVYNGHPDAYNFGGPDRISLERMWDIILTKRLAELNLGILFGLAVDDAHQYGNYWPEDHIAIAPGRGWIVYRSRYLTPESLIHAMEAGEFYASTGVTLQHLKTSNGGIELEIKPEENTKYTIEFIGTRRGYDPSSEPILDAEGNPRAELTKRYSDDIGQVLATAQGTRARYEFQGDEIYVRARITSSNLHPNPYIPNERQKAWIQPVVPPAP